MPKKFNITGICFDDEHYMADVSGKIAQIRKMVAEGDYFIINRPRQYGKTTTLYTLTQALNKSGEYIAFKMSFEGVGESLFHSEENFSGRFVQMLAKAAKTYAPDLSGWLARKAPKVANLDALSDLMADLVHKTKKKFVILIDEVDKSSNNQLFVSFLAMLRDMYLERRTTKTFHSVVLAGVHDVKSLKLKLRPDEEKKLNSPWNIAAEFKVDMNLQPAEIIPMLHDYMAERGVKMDADMIAERLFYYTSGYPFLVSKLCKMVDEEMIPLTRTLEWTVEDLDKAARKLVKETNTNFETLSKNLIENEALYRLVYQVAVDGDSVPFDPLDPIVNFAVLYGLLVDKGGQIAIHNRIYGEVIVNFMTNRMYRFQLDKGTDFGSGYKKPDNSLDMQKVLLKFQAFMREQYSKKDRDFLERNGRLVFLSFLRPIINGSGYDMKETQVSEERRLDVVVTFNQFRYIIELKLWRGKVAHEEGLSQLADYLDRLALTEGYLLIFDHSEVKSWESGWLNVGVRRVFAAWV